MRLRQVALAARELDPVVEDLCAVLGIEVAFNDPGVGEFGLRNAVMTVGDTFLEVVSPERDDAPAARWLDRNGGDGGYMAIFQTEDLDAHRRRMRELGVRVVWEVALEDAATLHLHPRDVGGAIVSLDAMEPPESWRWAGPRWREHARLDVVTGISGVELCAREPDALARRWSEVLDRPVGPVDGVGIPLEGGRVAFSAGERDAIVAIDFDASDAGRAREQAKRRGCLGEHGDPVIAGVRLRLRLHD